VALIAISREKLYNFCVIDSQSVLYFLKLPLSTPPYQYVGAPPNGRDEWCITSLDSTAWDGR
jgi:hypothetical protein